MKRTLPITLALALSSLAVATVWSQQIHQDDKGLYSTRELSEAVALGAGNEIAVRCASGLRGSLAISTIDSDSVRIAYVKRAKAADKSNARDFIDLIAVVVHATASGARLELRAPNPPPWKDADYGQVDLQLWVPRNMSLDIDAVYFDVVAQGPFTRLENTTSLGRLTVNRVTELLRLATANRRVTVDNAMGDISLSTSNSTLVARDIKPTGKPASLRNDGGDIKIVGCTGGVNARNSYGRIDIAEFDPQDSKSYIRCTSGPIAVSLTGLNGGQLLLNNRYEDIDLTLPAELSAILALVVDEGGKIMADNFTFKPELVQTNRLNLVTGDGDGLISGSVRGKGNIYVRGLLEDEE